MPQCVKSVSQDITFANLKAVALFAQMKTARPVLPILKLVNHASLASDWIRSLTCVTRVLQKIVPLVVQIWEDVILVRRVIIWMCKLALVPWTVVLHPTVKSAARIVLQRVCCAKMATTLQMGNVCFALLRIVQFVEKRGPRAKNVKQTMFSTKQQ